MKLILFNTENERFGTFLLDIIGVTKIDEIMRVRNEKFKWILGNIFWYHSLLPVIDLQSYLSGLKTVVVRQNERLLVVGNTQRKIGIAVLKIDKMVNVKEEEICELPDMTLSSRNKRFISGVWREEMVVILNLQKLLSEKEWKDVEKVGRE